MEASLSSRPVLGEISGNSQQSSTITTTKRSYAPRASRDLRLKARTLYGEQFTYDTLRKAVKEAWDAIPEDFLRELIQGMPGRCQKVKDTNGMHINA